jgi:hypothetical protein
MRQIVVGEDKLVGPRPGTSWAKGSNNRANLMDFSRGPNSTGETREYVEKRRAEGRTDKEIRRCIKRYLARRIYRALSSAAIAMNAA